MSLNQLTTIYEEFISNEKLESLSADELLQTIIKVEHKIYLEAFIYLWEYHDRQQLKNSASIETSEKYWNCNCRDNYVQTKAIHTCPCCQANQDNQPHSMLREIETQGCHVEDFLNQAENAQGILIDNFISKDYSLTSLDELYGVDDPIMLSIYCYGEHGLKREYDITLCQILKGTKNSSSFILKYFDDKPIEIKFLK